MKVRLLKLLADTVQSSLQFQSYLKRYMQSKHAGITYQCDKCDAVFTQTHHVERHKQSKHAGIKYPCDK